MVLIPKAGKDPALSSSYRPICLLNTFGKLYERMLVNRLNAELEEGEIISSRQHGFRRRRSTVSELMDLREIYQENQRRWCIAIPLEIRNAFNSVGWRDIMNELEAANISSFLIKVFQDYLKNGTVIVSNYRHRCSKRVMQGSVAGPVLWNLFYNGVLGLALPEGAFFIAYADDLLLVILKDTEEKVRQMVEGAMEAIFRWMEERNLEMALHKSEVIVLKGPRTSRIKINIDSAAFEPMKEVNYLVVRLSRNMEFSRHISAITEKTRIKIEV